MNKSEAKDIARQYKRHCAMTDIQERQLDILLDALSHVRYLTLHDGCIEILTHDFIIKIHQNGKLEKTIVVK